MAQKTRISYPRSPSDDLWKLLKPGGFLAPLIDLNKREIGGHELDIHLRVKDEVQVYCGLTRVLKVRRLRSGDVKVTADPDYTEQPCATKFFRTWNTNDSGFSEAIEAYLNGVKVNPRFTKGEGQVQSQWSRVTEPWVPIDREAVLKYDPPENRPQATSFPEVEAARGKLMDVHEAQRTVARRAQWAAPPKGGHELDQLAIDRECRLLLIELKDASKRTANVYYAPFQLLQYVWEWRDAIKAMKADLQTLIDARVAIGLTPPEVAPLKGGIRAAVGFGPDHRTTEVKRRYDMVLDIANQHLPPGVSAIETWEYTDNGPCEVGRK